MSRNTVWLTRPAQQVEALRQSLQDMDIPCFHLPLIDIEALPDSEQIKSRVLQLDQYDLAFFISTNAARLGLEYIDRYWLQYPAGLENFALGPATAKVLQDYGLDVIYPLQAMSSEAVLALPELKVALAEKPHARVIIFRGEGGRELLAGTLREKGAEVDYLEVYRRKLPEYDADYLRTCLEDMPPQTVIISSAEGLENFVSLISPLQQNLKDIPLSVSSDRLGEIARQKGFNTVNVMSGASDQAIIKSLQGSNYE